jgi:N-acetylglucosamine kinase-like BadF-type ATPase
MIVVADSGSTKCDWVVVDPVKGTRFDTNTKGINPFFHNEVDIANEVFRNDVLRNCGTDVTNVYFYCAGGSSKELQAKVARGLHIIFKDSDIKVDHDLDGAAYATCHGKPGISCILGTGSNSCYFDGTAIHEEVPALAYILGDEGSGSYYGKKLLRDYFYKTMPKEIRGLFEAEFKPDKDVVFERVYMKPYANVFLASFMRFCSEHREKQYIKDMIHEGMYEFLNIHVCCYKNYREVPVHFVGSIAFYFEEILREHCKNLHIQVGVITNKPVDELVRYHLEKDFPVKSGNNGHAVNPVAKKVK